MSIDSSKCGFSRCTTVRQRMNSDNSTPITSSSRTFDAAAKFQDDSAATRVERGSTSVR